MSERGYVIRGGVEGRERLRVLSRVMQPTTRTLFERVGIRAGMSCLDVGCGGGDASLELAAIVGSSGRVVGIDRDKAVIAIARREAIEKKLEGVEFRVGELGRENAGEFDFVYARFVLTHLPDPAQALAWMHGLVRPGGVLVLEDIDFRGHFTHPHSSAFWRYVELYTQLVHDRGADPNIGPRLPELLRRCGCEGVQMNVVQPAGITGEVKLIAAITMENVAESLVAAGLASQAEIDEIVRELRILAADSVTVVSLPRIVQAWGSRAR